MTDTLTRGPLPDLVAILRDEHARSWDVVVPAKNLAMTDDGNVTVTHTATATIPAGFDETGAWPERTETTTEQATMVPTRIGHDDLGQHLEIPGSYYRRMQSEAPPLLAENVNHWLQAGAAKYYVRCLRGAEDQPGVIRCIRSDRFRAIDNLDVTMAVLTGIRATGVDASRLHIDASLTDERMHIRIDCPEITTRLGDLVERYRRPDGTTGHGQVNDLVSAGIEVRNSDVGRGAFAIVPRLKVLVCTNGLTVTKDARRSVHVGGRQDEGVVDWSDETMRRRLAVVESETTDAVRLFLTADYLDKVVGEIRGLSTATLDKPTDTVVEVARKLRYTEVEQQSILDAFVKGGDLTPFGVAQAFTWCAQQADVTRGAEMEDDAWRAMELAGATIR